MAPRKIHLLFVLSSLRIGGAEKHVVTLINNLDQERFRCSLVYLKDEADLLPQIDRSRVKGALYCASVQRKLDIAALNRITDTVCLDAIDVIVCTNMYALLYGSIAKKMARTGAKVVEVFHTTQLRTWKDKLQMLLYHPIFRACDKLIYVCESQRSFWKKRALQARSDAVIYNGIDVDHFFDRYSDAEKSSIRLRYGFGRTDYVIGLCAALRPEKSHGDLLQALAILKSKGIAAKCLFIGDGPERKKIENQISTLGLEQDAKITGFADDVRTLIASCDVMALVSHSVETFSIAALEAMALGKPLVMSDVGGAREQVMDGENGYVFSHGNIEPLAKALIDLSDVSLRSKMGNSARSIVAGQFTLSRMISSFDDVFLQLKSCSSVGGH
jgi:glycosyltransferase involved in cell wall biosynthesis